MAEAEKGKLNRNYLLLKQEKAAILLEHSRNITSISPLILNEGARETSTHQEIHKEGGTFFRGLSEARRPLIKHQRSRLRHYAQININQASHVLYSPKKVSETRVGVMVRGRAFALHVPDLGLIPGIPHGLWSQPGLILKCRDRVNPEHSQLWPKNQTNNNDNNQKKKSTQKI